jgi:hypothetical protein
MFNELFKELKEVEDDLSSAQKGLGITENREELISAIRLNLFHLSEKLLFASNKEVIYWSYCSTATYNSTYKSRLKEALNNSNNKIHNEIEFVESEIEDLVRLKNNSNNSYYHPDLFKSIDKKVALLKKKKQKLSPESEEVLLDFSDSKGAEKIIYLYKLGVLDFLREKSAFNSSTNNLAKFLSAVTGEKASTLQSYLNPIYSPQTDQKNNPLIKKTSVKKVEKQINTMGISL